MKDTILHIQEAQCITIERKITPYLTLLRETAENQKQIP